MIIEPLPLHCYALKLAGSYSASIIYYQAVILKLNIALSIAFITTPGLIDDARQPIVIITVNAEPKSAWTAPHRMAEADNSEAVATKSLFIVLNVYNFDKSTTHI